MNSIILRYRTLLRKCIIDLLSLMCKPAQGIHILNGHFLSLNDDASPNIFHDQLKGLEKVGVQFINFDVAVKRIINGDIPNDKCLVAFSWDDGFLECFTKIKPVLDEHGIKAAFFINPNFIDGDEDYRQNFMRNVVLTNKLPMSWTQIETLLHEGHTIGAHTLDHASLNTDDSSFLEHQMVGCKKRMEDLLKVEIEHFAFPYGQFKFISRKGIDIALKTYRYVYSQSNYRNYFSFSGKVINRRHFECSWPVRHVVFFLKSKRFEKN